MSDTIEMPQPEESGSLVGDVGAAPAENAAVHDTVVPPVQPSHRDELVKVQPAALKKSSNAKMSIDKIQNIVFVRMEDAGWHTEFVLEDVLAVQRLNGMMTVTIPYASLNFNCSAGDAETLLDAWRAKRAARRNA